MLAAICASLVWLGVTANGLNDYAGRPLGTDFANVYAAGVAVAQGDPTAPFDAARQQAAERALFGPQKEFFGWHYPPFFLLVAAVLAQLPYIPALIVWQGATLLLYLGAMRLLLQNSAAPDLARDRLWPLLALGFTAAFVNLTHGHNGFLTAALFAGALALLDRRPLLAGCLFGLTAYKPQFALVIPVVLAVTGRWRVFGGAAATVIVLAVAATALFGAAVWPAFLESTHFTRTVVLEEGGTGFYKIQSVFAWIRLWGGSVALAYAAQFVLTALVVIGLLRLWRSYAADGYKGAALCLGALLATLYSLDYDLMLLAPAILLLAAEGRSGKFVPWEASLLALLWLLPAATREIARVTYLPLAVLAMLVCFVLTLRRARAVTAP
jgi:alpha-1,2-mannosyltransferase